MRAISTESNAPIFWTMTRWGEYTDAEPPAAAELIRIVVDLEPRPTVQTVRGMAPDDPWHLSYLAVAGDLSPYPDPQNTWNGLRRDLTFDDVLTIRGVAEAGSPANLLALVRDFTAVSAVELSRSKLPSGLQGGYNKGFQSSSRFEWSDDVISQQFGPNIVVVYEPGSPEDSHAHGIFARDSCTLSDFHSPCR